MLGTLFLAGRAMLLALISFAAGRFVGWHARGHHDAVMGPLREAAQREGLAEIDTMIAQHQTSLNGGKSSS